MRQFLNNLKNLPICLGRFHLVPTLLTRIIIGTVFVQSGWGKIHNISHVIDYFSSLGIPAPQIQAPLAAWTEFLCGLLILLGLATRLASIPLIVIMMVAIRTAKWGEINGISSIFEMSEFLYIVLLAWLITRGAGKPSVDAFIEDRYC